MTTLSNSRSLNKLKADEATGGDGTLQTDSISSTHLKSIYSHRGNLSGDLRDYVAEGTYKGQTTGVSGLPAGCKISGTFIMTVKSVKGTTIPWVQQTIQGGLNGQAQYSYVRVVFESGGTIYPTVIDDFWEDTTPFKNSDVVVDNTVLATQYKYRGRVTGQTFNQSFEDGTYTVVEMADSPPGLTANDNLSYTSMMRITLHGSNYQLQEVWQISDPSNSYTRINRPLLGTPQFNDWEKVDQGKLFGKNVVFMGDSITDSYLMPFEFGEATGANISNYGIGGTRIGHHDLTGYEGLSGYQLAEAMSSNNWTDVETAVGLTGKDAGSITGDTEAVEGLKNTVWADVDYLVIGYGTNDFFGNNTIGTRGDTDETLSFYAALETMVSNILATAPNVKIIWWSPIWRGTSPVEPDGIVGGSDVSPNLNGMYLTDYISAMKDVLSSYKQPFINMYETSGITEETKGIYLKATNQSGGVDLLHPTLTGAKHIASLLAASVESEGLLGVSNVIEGKSRLHLSDTLVAPVIAGEPTLTEISAALGSRDKDRIVYYTGTDLPASPPTYVFYIDSLRQPTALLNPVSNTAPIEIIDFVPTITGSTSVGSSGAGFVNPINFKIIKFGKFVQVIGRFDHYQEDSPVTINIPSGTFTEVSSLIATRETHGEYITPVNMAMTSLTEFGINRKDSIDDSHGMSLNITGTGSGVVSADMVGFTDNAAGGHFDLGTVRVVWGEEAAGAVGAANVAFDVDKRFANGAYIVTANPIGSGNNDVISIRVVSRSTDSFDVYRAFEDGAGTDAAGVGFTWMAIGVKP